MAISPVPWPGVRIDPPAWTKEGGTRRARLVYETPGLAAAAATLEVAAALGGYAYPDISPHTPVGDWVAFWRAYPIAAAKATEGRTWRSGQWPAFLREARNRGRLPVAYHFLWPGAISGIGEQAVNFVDYAWDGRPMGIMLDVETTGTGENPTMADASAWLSAVARLVGVPRSSMLVYLPRWWWQAHGGGSTATRDSLLLNSDYRSTPNLAPFAGYDQVDALQFGSTIPIAGVGPGDMNRWLDGQAAMSTAMFGQGGTVAFDEDQKRYLDWLALWIAGRPNRIFNPDAIAARLEVGVDFRTPPGAEEIDGLATGLAGIGERLDGLKVEVDVTKLTPDQLTLIGSVFAGKAVITGLQAASDGTFTVTFAPAP